MIWLCRRLCRVSWECTWSATRSSASASAMPSAPSSAAPWSSGSDASQSSQVCSVAVGVFFVHKGVFYAHKGVFCVHKSIFCARTCVKCILCTHVDSVIVCVFCVTVPLFKSNMSETLSQYVRKSHIMSAAAATVNASLICLLLLWSPSSEHQALFFVIPALWGVADAVWQTQINGGSPTGNNYRSTKAFACSSSDFSLFTLRTILIVLE